MQTEGDDSKKDAGAASMHERLRKTGEWAELAVSQKRDAHMYAAQLSVA